LVVIHTTDWNWCFRGWNWIFNIHLVSCVVLTVAKNERKWNCPTVMLRRQVEPTPKVPSRVAQSGGPVGVGLVLVGVEPGRGPTQVTNRCFRRLRHERPPYRFRLGSRLLSSPLLSSPLLSKASKKLKSPKQFTPLRWSPRAAPKAASRRPASPRVAPRCPLLPKHADIGNGTSAKIYSHYTKNISNTYPKYYLFKYETKECIARILVSFRDRPINSNSLLV